MTAALVAAGVGIGAAAGAVGAIGASLLHLIGKRLRNAALVRRGEPPIKDVLFAPAPVVVLLGGIGAVAGALAAPLAGAWWPAAALAGLAAPALLSAVALAVTAAQAR